MESDLRKFEEIYEKVDEILGGQPVFIIGANVGRTEKVTEENINKLCEYAKEFLKNTDKGLIHTMLINLKPFQSYPQVKKIFDELVKRKKSI